MNLLLHGRNGRGSCAAIKEAGANVEVLRKRSGRNLDVENVDTLIRWAVPVTVPAEISYQEPEAVSLAFNKKETRELLQVCNVSVPLLTETWFPCIGRPTHHRAGQGFFLCNNAQDVITAKRNGATYFSKIYPKSREFRFHVAHGMILFASEKKMPEGYDGLVFNHQNGAYFTRIRWSEWPFAAVKLAIFAVRIVGLDYGAVDIMGYPTEDFQKPFVVSEINTSPTVGSVYNATLYAEYFNWLINTNPTEWVEINSDRPQDYAFRKVVNN